MAIGSDIVAKAMKHEGVKDFFFIMGGPMLAVESAALKLGMRGVDVRHEQAAAMAGFAYSRLLNKPSFCMAASGPATTNLVTGIAHAWADCTPVIALGGAAPVSTWHNGACRTPTSSRCSNRSPSGPTGCITRAAFPS